MTTVPHDHVHALGQSALVMAHCEIGLVYRLPKYLRHLRQTFAGNKGLRVLELGSAICACPRGSGRRWRQLAL